MIFTIFVASAIACLVLSPINKAEAADGQGCTVWGYCGASFPPCSGRTESQCTGNETNSHTQTWKCGGGSALNCDYSGNEIDCYEKTPCYWHVNKCTPDLPPSLVKRGACRAW